MPVTAISKPEDLLKCLPIKTQIREHGEEMVLTTIAVSLEKLSVSLNIPLSKIQLITLCEDIMDSYPYDSIEDVRECLKNARQGQYSFGHHSRSSITMLLVKDWMAQHLDKKAEVREKELAKLKKKNQDDKYKPVNYDKFKERLKEEKKTKKDDGFNNFKAKYLNERNNKSEEL